MEGRTISHYRVIERLGGGGMGVVYKAVDTRLDRLVALKFLPADLTRDDEARQRLIQEAKTASALDHPNICTVYDIDSTPEGQLFIAMSYYDGETLKTRIARGPIWTAETIDIALQVANGLAKAHDAGIIHRDIKPANIIVMRDGAVKIVDFGIAKLTGQTGATQTGVTLGTVTYMSPEQIEGRPLDGRTDVWSLGAVVYEMISGRPPFDGDQTVTVMNAIMTRDPAPLPSLRRDIPPPLVHVVERALRKEREKRYSTASAFARQLTECRAKLAAPPPVRQGWRILLRPKVAAAVLLVAAPLVALLGWSLTRDARSRRARAIIPEVVRLTEADKPAEALELAQEIEPFLPGDPTLQALLPRISRTISVVTKPPGAHAFSKGYADPAAEWRDLGVTPIQNIRVPVGMLEWKFTKEGVPDVEIAMPIDDARLQVASTHTLNVSLEGNADQNMVRVTGGAGGNTWITGIDPITRVIVADFSIDKYEVTNRQFKTFVQGGGYRKREYWDQPFAKDGKPLTWEEAMTLLVDATGRPGPAQWELGDYRAGQDDYPVTGVSWYEAAAFAKFAGKSLPTVAYWVHAAGSDYGASIEPLSNLQGTGLAPVGKFQGMGPYGTFDMAGNAREWCWNAWGDGRYILGGAWPDPQYMFTYANVQSPFDRSATNGFRLVKYSGEIDKEAAKPVELLARDYAKETPAGDDLFKVYKGQFSYDPAPLNARVEPLAGSPDYRAEKASFDTGYGKDKLLAYVLLPTSGTPPYQAVVMFPGSFAINVPSVGISDLADSANFVLKSGRALVLPIYRGTFERREGLTSTWPDQSRRYADFVVSWVRDAKRTLDYLESRKDIDAKRIAFFGTSWGGRMGAIIPAVEPRFKAVILNSGGLASGKAQPEVDQLNFVTRVTQPTLMLNGRSDAIEPVETAQRPMFESLGTPREHVKWLLLDDGHMVPAHRNEVAREALLWLDRYLGPTN